MTLRTDYFLLSDEAISSIGLEGTRLAISAAWARLQALSSPGDFVSQ